ncbi:ketoacyl-ACP synthase III [Kitasatospora sp. MAA4]|uniref:3-oxoacyl-ACP synthase III family protein n=1 Tax=Kitasatospora sp. MAA4 TaxID=3035093 RepID=UPI002475BAD2|nr:ketoacyl-ACP synthase III [Kitasatospora sp. MAA4]
MADAEQHASGILGTGSYLPKQEIDNTEVAARTGVSEEWIARKTEILCRRYAAPDEATSDLAAQAGEAALAQAGLAAEEIDYLIVSTSTGDSPQPPTSTLVQHLLGARRAACLDVNVVCSGFVYALALAHSLTSTHPGRRALVIAADVYSRILDFDDHRTATLLGDGAGAAVVGPVPAPYGFLDFGLSSRGDAHRLIRVEAGGSRLPASHQTVDEGGHFFRMDGRGVSEFVMENVPGAVADLVAGAGVRLDEVDHLVPHQANGVLLRQLVELIGVPNARTHRTLERYGNVGSASVAVALDDANRSGALRNGDLVVLAGFGGGMAIGTGLLRWGVAA